MRISGRKRFNLALIMIVAMLFSTACAEQASDTRHSGTGQGFRTDAEIQSAFDNYKSHLYRIYNNELLRKPGLEGKIIFSIVIEPSGVVSACKVRSSTVDDKILETRIADAIKTMNFGSKQGPMTKILYPIEFFKPSAAVNAKFYSGLIVQDMSAELFDMLKGAIEGGILVADTCIGSPAEKSGLKRGDIITRVGEFDIHELHDFYPAIQSGEKSHPAIVVNIYRISDGKQSITVKRELFNGEHRCERHTYHEE